ncbi:DUF2007 domain-containing protein [Paracrocinitomix mangrovi]|uniref:putative signal transducing protein n=1 Tax=Paracrocinitomix mangrovi TaxID=2862509 RepID=UPI001C8E779C|nr:DUF2007 domain-containing protein [Paracrocinitomix mangrovi]UKN01692.1 DUF2007 domain-containing protein [Paracrocinitomix mangrovi]
MENRVTVYSSDSEQSAEIIKSKLISEGIDAIVLDKKDHLTEVVGNYEVLVHPEDETKAKALID